MPLAGPQRCATPCHHPGWTDNTFNPWGGCQKVSDGCKYCYAERIVGAVIVGTGTACGGFTAMTIGNSRIVGISRLCGRGDGFGCSAGRSATSSRTGWTSCGPESACGRWCSAPPHWTGSSSRKGRRTSAGGATGVDGSVAGSRVDRHVHRKSRAGRSPCGGAPEDSSRDPVPVGGTASRTDSGVAARWHPLGNRRRRVRIAPVDGPRVGPGHPRPMCGRRCGLLHEAARWPLEQASQVGAVAGRSPDQGIPARDRS